MTIPDDLGYRALRRRQPHYYEALDAFTRHVPRADAAALRPVGGDRGPQASHRRRQARARGQEPDLGSDRDAGGDLGRSCAETRTGRTWMKALRERERAARLLHEPRCPSRQDGRAGNRGDVALPDPRRVVRGAPQATTRRRSRRSSTPSTDGWTRTGASPIKNPDLRGARISRLDGRRFRLCSELEWALAARCSRRLHAPRRHPHPRMAPSRPSDPRHDPFWARVSEAGITVVIHAGDSGYTTHGYVQDGFTADAADVDHGSPNIKHFNIERAAYDFLITVRLREALRAPFPGVRIASVENGAEFLADLFRKLAPVARPAVGSRTTTRKTRASCSRSTSGSIPFWEDDVYEVEHFMGSRPRDLRLGLAAYRGDADSRSTM